MFGVRARVRSGLGLNAGVDPGTCCRPLALSAGGGVRCVAVVVVVRAHLLNQFVVNTVKGDVDANYFEGLGAEPGDVALGLLLVAHLGRVEAAQRCLLVPVCLFVFDATVESFGVFGLQRGLLSRLELHRLGGRDQADGHVPQPRGVVAKVYAEGAVPVIHNFPCDRGSISLVSAVLKSYFVDKLLGSIGILNIISKRSRNTMTEN